MSVHTVSLEGLASDLRRLPERARKAMVRGLFSAALRTKAEVVIQIDTTKPFPPIDRGTMRRSVDVDRHPDGALLSVGVPYAAVMEHGTRPFFPPLQPLEDWVERKGLAGKRPRVRMRKSEKEGGGLGKAEFLERKATAAAQYQSEIKSIAYAIALKISREGIAPRHFFAKAMEKVPVFLRQEIEREMERL